MNRNRGQRVRATAAIGFAGAILWAVFGFGPATAVAAGSTSGSGGQTVVTAGNQQITFSGTSTKGAIGDSGGYDTLAFNFETGQGGMFGDLQIGTDASGNPTLSGNVEVVPPGGSLATSPSSATVPAIAGEVLLVLDSAGNYALVQVTNATPQTVWFTYILQSSVVTTPPPLPPSTPSQNSGSSGQSSTGSPPVQNPVSPPVQNPSPQPTPPQGSSTSGGQGVYAMPGNCVAVTDGSGNQALQVGVNVTPMFADQGQTVAQATPSRALVLNVGIVAPTDVTNVSVHQSGQIGGNSWTTPLYANPLGQNTATDWTFSMQQTDLSVVYQIMITSATLAADGIANPSTSVTELDWGFNPTPGCGGSAQTAQAGQTSNQNTGQNASQNTSQTSNQNVPTTNPSAPPPSPTTTGPMPQTGNTAGSGQQSSPAVTIELQVGGTTATVNGQPQTLAVPAQVDAAGRTLVPFRFLGQALGAAVSWDGSIHTASYQLGSTDVAVTIGQSTATVNGRTVALDAPPVIVDGSTLVPVRFVSEALGATVSWDPSTQAVTITYTGSSTPGGGPTTSSGQANVPASSEASGGYSGGVPFSNCAGCIHWNFH